MQLQRLCHGTPPWRISVSLDPMLTRFIAAFIMAVSTCTAAEPWEVAQFVAYSEPQPLYLGRWGHDGKTLFATFMYAGSPASVRPKVALQVSQTWDGPWKTVARVRADREVLQSGARGDASQLRVRLGAFGRYLRSHKAGRVVLDTGESATISLCKLLHKNRAGGCD